MARTCPQNGPVPYFLTPPGERKNKRGHKQLGGELNMANLTWEGVGRGHTAQDAAQDVTRWEQIAAASCSAEGTQRIKSVSDIHLIGKTDNGYPPQPPRLPTPPAPI